MDNQGFTSSHDSQNFGFLRDTNTAASVHVRAMDSNLGLRAPQNVQPIYQDRLPPAYSSTLQQNTYGSYQENQNTEKYAGYRPALKTNPLQDTSADGRPVYYQSAKQTNQVPTPGLLTAQPTRQMLPPTARLAPPTALVAPPLQKKVPGSVIDSEVIQNDPAVSGAHVANVMEKYGFLGDDWQARAWNSAPGPYNMIDSEVFIPEEVDNYPSVYKEKVPEEVHSYPSVYKEKNTMPTYAAPVRKQRPQLREVQLQQQTPMYIPPPSNRQQQQKALVRANQAQIGDTKFVVVHEKGDLPVRGRRVWNRSLCIAFIALVVLLLIVVIVLAVVIPFARNYD